MSAPVITITNIAEKFGSEKGTGRPEVVIVPDPAAAAKTIEKMLRSGEGVRFALHSLDDDAGNFVRACRGERSSAHLVVVSDSLPARALAQLSRARSQLDGLRLIFVMTAALRGRLERESSDLASWLRPARGRLTLRVRAVVRCDGPTERARAEGALRRSGSVDCAYDDAVFGDADVLTLATLAEDGLRVEHCGPVYDLEEAGNAPPGRDVGGWPCVLEAVADAHAQVVLREAPPVGVTALPGGGDHCIRMRLDDSGALRRVARYVDVRTLRVEPNSLPTQEAHPGRAIASPPETPAEAALRALVALRDRLPVLVGPDWDDVRPTIEALLERGLRGEQQIDDVVSQILKALARFRDAVRPLQRAIESARTAAGARVYRSDSRGVMQSPGAALESLAVGAKSDVAVRALASQAKDAFADPESLHLNAWIEDHEAPDAELALEVPVQLKVNLGARRGTLASEPLSPEVLARVHEVEHVDVVVYCLMARVTPRGRRLHMPPNPAEEASFTLTPTRIGPLHASVSILVDNDEIASVDLRARVVERGGR